MSSCVHYKFANSKDYSTISFDGLAISLADLRDAVLVQKKMAKGPTFTLEVVNAQTKEEYKGDPSQTMIPRNASVLVRRVPLKTNKKVLDTTIVTGKADSPDPTPSHTAAKLAKTADLVHTDATEEEKIKAAMEQGTVEFTAVNLPKIQPPRRGGRPQHHAVQYVPQESMVLPSNYVCYRCGEKGHHIRNCPNPKSDVPIHVPGARNRGTGIPSEFLVPASDEKAPGVFRDRSGNLVIAKIDRDAYLKGKKLTKNDFPEGADVPDAPTLPVKEERVVPEELRCYLCKELMKDAALIPCCGQSFCDECIRDHLIKNDFVCPYCKELTSPDRLSPNAGLRLAIAKFLNNNLQDVPPTPEGGKKKIEFRLKTAGSSSSTGAKEEASSRKSEVVPELQASARQAEGEKKTDAASTANSTVSTPHRSPIHAGNDANSIGTPEKDTTPRASPPRSRSATPPHSGSDSESERRRRKIAQELQQTYQQVAGMQAVPGSVVPPFVPSVPPLFPGTVGMFPGAPVAAPAVVSDAPLLSEEDFYRLRNQLKKGAPRSVSRSMSPSVSVSRSRSPSQPRAPRYSRPLHRKSPSRSYSRSRSPPVVHTRSPSPRNDRYATRRYDERYNHRSRSPADYEAYRAWYDYHYSSRRGRGPPPPPSHADSRYHESRHRDSSRYRDDRYAEERYRDERYREERYRGERYRDDGYRERDQRGGDHPRYRSRSPAYPSYRELVDNHRSRKGDSRREHDRYDEESRSSSRYHNEYRGSPAPNRYDSPRSRSVKDSAPTTSFRITEHVDSPSAAGNEQHPKKKRRIVELVTVPVAAVSPPRPSHRPSTEPIPVDDVDEPSHEDEDDDVETVAPIKRRHSSHKKKKKKHKSKKDRTAAGGSSTRDEDEYSQADEEEPQPPPPPEQPKQSESHHRQIEKSRRSSKSSSRTKSSSARDDDYTLVDILVDPIDLTTHKVKPSSSTTSIRDDDVVLADVPREKSDNKKEKKHKKHKKHHKHEKS
eukprot:scpid24272/ scgid29767/ E3 ubiquitin-protein ligase RBBP6; Proliferation potential-related protein; Protein P2P-R; Retinoblastoma-binding Q protein 1; Retinoblastoma-binding protein 6; p53-associated cellular protein of testis